MKLNFWQWVGLAVMVASLVGIWLYRNREVTAPTVPEPSSGPPPVMTSGPVR